MNRRYYLVDHTLTFFLNYDAYVVSRKGEVYRSTWMWIRLKFTFKHKPTDHDCIEDEARISYLNRIHGT